MITDNRGTWNAGGMRGVPAHPFILPGSCKKWAAYMIDPRANDALNPDSMK
jgi:hypothetical protein